MRTGSVLRVGMALRLENGVHVMVPPLIAPGESIRVEAGRYVDRGLAARR